MRRKGEVMFVKGEKKKKKKKKKRELMAVQVRGVRRRKAEKKCSRLVV